MSLREDRSADDIRRSVDRKTRARNTPSVSPLRGLGAFGVIGWSVAVPTVAGAFLGMWLNRVAPQDFSWPIALIMAGITMGGIIAWRWIEKESSEQLPKDRDHNSHD